MPGELVGKAALIVGGSQHMGLAIAEAVGVRGASVVISYAHDDSAAEKAITRLNGVGVQARTFRADATDSADVERLFSHAIQLNGGIDIAGPTFPAAISRSRSSTSATTSSTRSWPGTFAARSSACGQLGATCGMRDATSPCPRP